MFQPRWTDRAANDYAAMRLAAQASLNARQQSGKAKATVAEGLFKQTRKCVELLLSNPRHPSLKTHKYDSLKHPWDPKQDVFEAYVQNHTPGAYRLFWCYGPNKNEITIIAITPHP
ncbi:hypothetical protein BH09PLA1_BH09PLA1_29340 [soil metagenome]